MPRRFSTWACLFLAAADVSGSVRHAAAVANTTEPLWVLSLFPFTGGVWDTGISLRQGAFMMLDEINKNPAILPGYELKVIYQDDQCNGGFGVMRLLENIFDNQYTVFAPGVPDSELDTDRDGLIETEDVEAMHQTWNATQVSPNFVGFVGACCSSVALDVSNILYKARVPFISPTATRPVLSDRTQFPNFFRSQMPDTAYSNPWIAIAKLLDQRSIVVVIGEGDWKSGGMDLAQAAAAQGVELAGPDLSSEIPGFHGLQITIDSAAAARGVASELLMLKRRIVIFLTYAPRARLVLCEAYRLGFLNAVYMPIGWLEPGWWAKTDTACTVDQLTRMATGQIVVSIVAFRTDADTRLSCSSSMTSGEFMTEVYARQVNASSHGYTPVVEPAFVADSLCMYALALHEVIFNQGVTPAELSARTPRAYSAMFAALSTSDFEGVSGRMVYTPGSADPQAAVIVRQVQAGGTVDIATYAHPRFNFLGKANLTFQFPGENWFAGPAGADTFSARLTPFVNCPRGKSPNLGSNTCEDCPANMEFVQAAEACLCVEGFYVAASGGCLPCQGGTFSNTAGTLSCTQCQAGKYSAPGATSCSLCPRGSYGETSGLSACNRCPSLQTTQEIGAAVATLCVCDQGSYRDAGNTSGTTCRACPANANTSGIASTTIADCNCRKGMYMSATGVCTMCPPGSTTLEGGKTSVASCLCNEGKYMPLGAGGCQPCPASMSCPRGSSEANFALVSLAQRSSEQQFPLLLPRYWSAAEEPMSVFDCRDDKKCPGGPPGNACAPNMLNTVACQHCIAAHHWNGQACVECKASKWVGHSLAILFGLAAPLVVIALYRFSGDAANLWGTRANAVMGLAFITLNHYQMIDLVVSGALIPVEFRWSSDTITWVNDWFRIFQPECTGVDDLTTEMVLKAASPIAVLLVCMLTYLGSVAVARLAKRPHLEMKRSRLFNIFGSLCFTFFGAISLMSMSLFKCSKNPNGHFTLAWELSVTCFSSNQWRSMLGIAIYCVLVYVIGIGSIFMRTIMVAPAHFQDPEFQVRWKFLFIRFHSGAYWWGIVYLAKNSLLQLAFVIFHSGWTGLSCALAGLIIYSGTSMIVMPYRTIIVNGVEAFSGSCVVYITSMLLLFTDNAELTSSGSIMTTIMCFGIAPLLGMFVGVGLVECYGKRKRATDRQVQKAERDFEDLVECAKALVAMDTSAGGELLLWLDDWERWACLQSAKVLRSDLLGMASAKRIAHQSSLPRSVTVVMKRVTSQKSLPSVEGADQEKAAEEKPKKQYEGDQDPEYVDNEHDTFYTGTTATPNLEAKDIYTSPPPGSEGEPDWELYTM